MKTGNVLLILCAVVTLSFAACKKEKNSNPLTPKEELLVRTWTLDSLTMKKIGEPATDSSLVTECIKKSKVVFTAGKDFQITDVAKNCDSTKLPYDSGKWTLSADGNKLVLKGKREIQWQIQMLNSDKLKATFRDSTSPQHNFVKTIVLKK